MGDYDDAASDFRTRHKASSSKTAHLKAFYEAVLASLLEEVKSANRSLVEENLPQITFEHQPEAQLSLAETKCKLNVVSESNLILAVYSGPSWEEVFRFMVHGELDVAHSPDRPWDPNAEVGPKEVAEQIVNRLIAVAS